MKKTNDYGRDSIPLLVLKTSVPFMLAQLVNVLYSIVDRIYVGNIPVIGADSLAGAGVCAPIITLLSSFGTLVGIGGSGGPGVTAAPVPETAAPAPETASPAPEAAARCFFPCVWEQGTKRARSVSRQTVFLCC